MGRNNSELMTPSELQAHAVSLLSSQERVPEAGTLDGYTTVGKQLTHYGKHGGENGCFKATALVHKDMPAGSRIVKMMMPYNYSSEGKEDGGVHYVHHVPTTEGPHVVDFTHRQFDPNAPHPVVEPLDSFNLRQASQNRGITRQLSTRDSNFAAKSALEGRADKLHNLQRRWVIDSGQRLPHEIRKL